VHGGGGLRGSKGLVLVLKLELKPGFLELKPKPKLKLKPKRRAHCALRHFTLHALRARLARWELAFRLVEVSQSDFYMR
jgi:hypothetical protein